MKYVEEHSSAFEASFLLHIYIFLIALISPKSRYALAFIAELTIFNLINDAGVACGNSHNTLLHYIQSESLTKP